MKTRHSLLALASASLVGLLSQSAFAAGPFTKDSTQLSLKASFGTSDWARSETPYGFGLGAGVGHTSKSGIYHGARFDWFVGDERKATSTQTDMLGGQHTTHSTSTVRNYSGVVSVGYDFAIPQLPALVLRPKLGGGVSVMRFGFGSGDSLKDPQPILTGGGEVLLQVTKATLAGVEARYDWRLAEQQEVRDNGLVWSATLGGKF